MVKGHSLFLMDGKYEGSWKNGVRWNGTSYDKDGKIYKKYVNGKWIKQ